MQPIACGLASLMAAMSRPSWKPGRRHGTQTTLSPKHLLVSCLAVGGGGDRDAGVGVEVVDVGGVDQAVHGGVDRRRSAALAVQAVVERGDHLVLALDAGIDVDQRPHPVQAQHRQPDLGQRAEVAAGSLHPQQLDVLAGHGVGVGALGRGVSAGVVGVPRVRAKPVRPFDERFHCGTDGGGRGRSRYGFFSSVVEEVVRRSRDRGQFHPAWAPPTRSASISFW